MSAFLCGANHQPPVQTADNPPPKEKRKKTVSRQYHESYLSYGCSWTGMSTILSPSASASGRFSLQIDESTDISGAAQLLENVRYVDADSIKETFFFCKEMESHTTGEEIFRVTNNYLKENSLTWNMCVSLCTDARQA